MKKVDFRGIASPATLVFASASGSQAYQHATVLMIQENTTGQHRLASNPSDAPLQSPINTYKLWFQVDCVTSVVRYNFWSDQPDSTFRPNRVIAANPQKHVLVVSNLGCREMKMSIVNHSTQAAFDSH